MGTPANTTVAVDLSIEDVIVLLAAGAEGPYALDPIRIMKGAFVVSQAGRSQWKELFKFRPYDYGPFDTRVYSARDRLIKDGLLSEENSRRYATYQLTPSGRERAVELELRLGDDAAWIERIGRYVTSKSFSRLLEEMYRRWPEFATNSVAR